MTTSRFLRLALLTVAAALSSLVLCAVPARAGLYTVSGTCGLWTPVGSGIAIYPACPALVARNSGPQSTPYAIGGGWRFDPPPGTAIASANLQASLTGANGWQALVYTEGISAREVVACPGLGCPLGSTGVGEFPAYNSGALIIGVRCIATSGCSGAGVYGQAQLNASTITLSDASWPNAVLSGGSLLSGGWKSGTQTLTVDGVDNLGVREVRALVDGDQFLAVVRACDFSQKVPCSNGETGLQLALGGLTDGEHTIAAQAVDASGNVGRSAASSFYVDNSAPTQPLDVQIRGGVGWRAQDRLSLTWRNPPQSAAPIAGAAYRVCPQSPSDADPLANPAAQAQCESGSRAGTNLTAIDDITLPGPGIWTLQLWLIDAAGNQQPASAVELDNLGYDNTPPEAVAFQPPDPQDPARVRVAASDPVSGLASGVIEVI